jgi:malate dehydrogenase
MGVYSAKNPYGIDENLVYSFPVKCKNFTWEYESGLS